SMLELQHHQPELRRIQQQYKDDRQRMNEELMKFYQEHKINPVGGCLPMLLQLPVFFVLYSLIRGLTSRMSLLEAVARHGNAALAGTFDPKHIDEGTALHTALGGDREMVSWGIDLSRSAVDAASEGFGTALPYALLILLATAASYIQQRQIQGRNPNAQINPQMQMITRIMPLMLTAFSLVLPAALVVYFCVSGLYRIGQQGIITRHIYHPHQAKLASAGDKTVTTTARETGDGDGERGTKPKSTTAKDSPATGAEPAPPGRGLFSRLFGAPPAVGAGGDTTTATTTSGAGGNGSAKPAARPTGRVTPPGGRPPGSRPTGSRKKKKRK
ncbi:MAG: YidC/Oxa1 family membrane protein insertase, partial [Acidimicrobiales bacterium]